MKTLLFLVLFPAVFAKAQSLDARITLVSQQLVCPRPDEQNPVSMNARLVQDEDSIAVILKVSMAPGWHIYTYVPPGKPYIVSRLKLELPEHYKAIGDWAKPEPETISTDPGVLIYKDEVIFVHKVLNVSKDDTVKKIRAGLYYQTCDLRQCLPPREKIFDLGL